MLKSALKTSTGSQISSSGGSVQSNVSSQVVSVFSSLHNPNPNKLRILFTTLQKAVLDYQLKVHDEYLKYFKEAYHRADEDVDGILNTDQLYQVYQMMGLQKPSSKYLSIPAVPSTGRDNGGDGGGSSTDVLGGGGDDAQSLNSLHSRFMRLGSGTTTSSELDQDRVISGSNMHILSSFSKFVNLVDPLGTDIIVFSECVNAINKMSSKQIK